MGNYATYETQSNKDRNSNFYEKGSAVYKLKDISVSHALAIENADGSYVKAMALQE